MEYISVFYLCYNNYDALLCIRMSLVLLPIPVRPRGIGTGELSGLPVAEMQHVESVRQLGIYGVQLGLLWNCFNEFCIGSLKCFYLVFELLPLPAP